MVGFIWFHSFFEMTQANNELITSKCKRVICIQYSYIQVRASHCIYYYLPVYCLRNAKHVFFRSCCCCSKQCNYIKAYKRPQKISVWTCVSYSYSYYNSYFRCNSFIYERLCICIGRYRLCRLVLFLCLLFQSNIDCKLCTSKTICIYCYIIFSFNMHMFCYFFFTVYSSGIVILWFFPRRGVFWFWNFCGFSSCK